MNEHEWLQCSHPREMLDHLRNAGLLSERKGRLFEVGCCHRIWPLITHDAYRNIVEVAERFADGKADGNQMDAADQSALAIPGTPNWDPALWAAILTAGSPVFLWSNYDTEDTSYSNAAYAVAVACGEAEQPVFSGPRQLTFVDPTTLPPAEEIKWIEPEEPPPTMKVELRAQAGLLRDLFGNPFRPLSIDASWLTPPVVQLAQEIYERRSFERMPELADVLEEVGCSNVDILVHCKGGGEHVRGCWVVDALLGKT